MNFFEKILNFFNASMTTPTNYGWFHLMYVALAIITTVLLCVFFKNASNKTFKRIVLICWIIMIVLEVYKQINFSWSYNTTLQKSEWRYQWYAFPFQLCSTPLYVLPFVIFLKEGKVRDAFVSFMMTFSFFGGLVVFLYPNDVFVSTIGINIQTMTHHGLQFVLGIYFAVYNRKRLNFKFFASGIIVFAGLFTIAFLLNVLVPLIFKINGSFNMFYIGPNHPCTLPLLGDVVYPNVPYVVFLLIYVLGFSLASLIIFYSYYGIIKLVEKIYEKKQNNKNCSAN